MVPFIVSFFFFSAVWFLCSSVIHSPFFCGFPSFSMVLSCFWEASRLSPFRAPPLLPGRRRDDEGLEPRSGGAVWSVLVMEKHEVCSSTLFFFLSFFFLFLLVVFLCI